eukprot:g12092.t1
MLVTTSDLSSDAMRAEAANKTPPPIRIGPIVFRGSNATARRSIMIQRPKIAATSPTGATAPTTTAGGTTVQPQTFDTADALRTASAGIQEVSGPIAIQNKTATQVGRRYET